MIITVIASAKFELAQFFDSFSYRAKLSSNVGRILSMPEEFVRISGNARRRYYEMLKLERKEAAEYYRDNANVTIRDCMKKFRMSYATLHKALNENNIAVDRYRSPVLAHMRGAKYWQCDTCGGRHRYQCTEPPWRKVVEQDDPGLAYVGIDPADVVLAIASTASNPPGESWYRLCDKYAHCTEAWVAAVQRARHLSVSMP
jgi:hypothetical protein